MTFDNLTQPAAWKKALWTGGKIALAIFLVAFVMTRTSRSDCVELFHKTRMGWLVVSFLAFVGVNWLGALRLWDLVGRCVKFGPFLNVVIFQNAVSSFVAGGAGAVSYVGMLKGEHAVSLKTSVASLLLARMGDLTVTGVMLLVSAWAVWSQISTLRGLTILLVSLIGFGTLVFVLLVSIRHRIIALLNRMLAVLRLSDFVYTQRVMGVLSEVVQQESQVLIRLHVTTVGYSFVMFGVTYIWVWSNVLAFQIPIGPWQVLYMVALAQLISIIPILVFGGLGVMEVTSLYLYGIFGITQSQIAPALVGGRLLFYAFNGLILCVIPIQLWMTRHQRAGGGPSQKATNQSGYV